MTDIVRVEDEYYVRASSALADDRTRVLKYGDTFAVFNRYGDIEPLGLSRFGLFHAETRHLSRFTVRLNQKQPLPDLIIVDLDLGYESGFELLRFWHGNPALSTIRLIVWTAMGEEQQHICRLFKVDAVISKTEGIDALRRAIEPLTAAAS